MLIEPCLWVIHLVMIGILVRSLSFIFLCSNDECFEEVRKRRQTYFVCRELSAQQQQHHFLVEMTENDNIIVGMKFILREKHAWTRNFPSLRSISKLGLVGQQQQQLHHHHHQHQHNDSLSSYNGITHVPFIPITLPLFNYPNVDIRHSRERKPTEQHVKWCLYVISFFFLFFFCQRGK